VVAEVVLEANKKAYSDKNYWPRQGHRIVGENAQGAEQEQDAEKGHAQSEYPAVALPVRHIGFVVAVEKMSVSHGFIDLRNKCSTPCRRTKQYFGNRAADIGEPRKTVGKKIRLRMRSLIKYKNVDIILQPRVRVSFP
jgi:hypothetical protein